MKGAGRNAEIIAEAIEYTRKGFDLLNQAERTAEPISGVRVLLLNKKLTAGVRKMAGWIPMAESFLLRRGMIR